MFLLKYQVSLNEDRLETALDVSINFPNLRIKCGI